MSVDQQARRLMALLRAQMIKIADQRASRKTGITPRVGYSTVYFDDSGHAYAGTPGGGGLGDGVAFFNGSIISVTIGTNSVVSWSSGDQQWDDAGYWSASDPTEFTAPVTGTYLCVGGCSGNIPSGTVADIRLSLQAPLSWPGQTFGAEQSRMYGTSGGVTGSGFHATPTGIVKLAAGEYVHLRISAFTVTGSGSFVAGNLSFMMHRIG